MIIYQSTRGLLGTLLCLQNTQVLMFPVNTIIAWYVNIYHKCEDMIITTLLLPLGHISNRKVWGVGAPPSLYIQRGGRSPSPSPKPRPAAPRRKSGGQGNPPSRRSNQGLSLVWPAGPYGALCPWPNAARALPHSPTFRKVLEASGTIPINPEQFRTPKTALPYMNLILRTILEPLVMSRIPSETPNKNS